MSSRRLYDKVMTIVGTMMILFYFGMAYVVLFSSIFSHIDIVMRSIFGIPFILYGFYRTFVAYNKIKENFFEQEDD
jgi:hypothetical protein